MPMYRYQPGILEDTGLLAWWAAMGAAGDLEPTCGVAGMALTGFVRQMAGQTLWYTSAAGSWDRVAWHGPHFGLAGTFGLWLRGDVRHTPSSLRFLRTVLDDAVSTYPVVVSYCRAAGVADQLVRLGFARAAFIPGILDGPEDGAHLCYITPTMFDAKGAA